MGKYTDIDKIIEAMTKALYDGLNIGDNMAQRKLLIEKGFKLHFQKRLKGVNTEFYFNGVDLVVVQTEKLIDDGIVTPCETVIADPQECIEFFKSLKKL